eukprot:7721282-Pyramimonas_sp.AAC.1
MHRSWVKDGPCQDRCVCIVPFARAKAPAAMPTQQAELTQLNAQLKKDPNGEDSVESLFGSVFDTPEKKSAVEMISLKEKLFTEAAKKQSMSEQQEPERIRILEDAVKHGVAARSALAQSWDR